MSRLILCCASIFLLASCAHDDEVKTPCPKVSSVQEIPFRDERSADEVYNRLRYDDACESTLHSSLTSLTPMPDPRQMPPEQRFVEGDTALFLLLARHQLDISQLLPVNQATNWERQRMMAYFNYVSSFKNRLQLIKNLNELLDE